MEVLASLIAGLKREEARAAADRTNKRYLRLTKTQILSSLLSLGDWVSDWVYALRALAWTAGGYALNASEKLACIEYVGEHGPGAFIENGDSVGDTGSWDSANCTEVTDVSLAVQLCAEPRTVDVPGIVLAALFFAAGMGALSDIIKGGTVYFRDRKAEERATYYAKRDAGEDTQEEREYGCLDYETRARTHGWCTAGGVILEDAVQLVGTSYVEFVCKPDALVAPVGVGGVSSVAWLSLLFGLVNALIKLFEGCHEARAGVIHSLDATTRELS